MTFPDFVPVMPRRGWVAILALLVALSVTCFVAASCHAGGHPFGPSQAQATTHHCIQLSDRFPVTVWSGVPVSDLPICPNECTCMYDIQGRTVALCNGGDIWGFDRQASTPYHCEWR
jgi:hypothetical protein